MKANSQILGVLVSSHANQMSFTEDEVERAMNLILHYAKPHTALERHWQKAFSPDSETSPLFPKEIALFQVLLARKYLGERIPARALPDEFSHCSSLAGCDHFHHLDGRKISPLSTDAKDYYEDQLIEEHIFLASRGSDNEQSAEENHFFDDRDSQHAIEDSFIFDDDGTTESNLFEAYEYADDCERSNEDGWYYADDGETDGITTEIGTAMHEMPCSSEFYEDCVIEDDYDRDENDLQQELIELFINEEVADLNIENMQTSARNKTVSFYLEEASAYMSNTNQNDDSVLALADSMLVRADELQSRAMEILDQAVTLRIQAKLLLKNNGSATEIARSGGALSNFEPTFIDD